MYTVSAKTSLTLQIVQKQICGINIIKSMPVDLKGNQKPSKAVTF